jgi:hypothetical protein
VSDDNRLSIGGFTLVSGLSITALRHYDEVGVLKPAFVDPITGYRRYRFEQTYQGRLISILRRSICPSMPSGKSSTSPTRPLSGEC